MVNHNLINQLDGAESTVDAELEAALGLTRESSAIESLLEPKSERLAAGTLLTGRIVGRAGSDVVVDVGLKSEGVVPADEWEDESDIDVGDEVNVWLEAIESD